MTEDTATLTALSATTTTFYPDSPSPAVAPSSSYRGPRHQFTRSLSEISSPMRLHGHNNRHRRLGSRERDSKSSPAPNFYSPLSTSAGLTPTHTTSATVSGLVRSSRPTLQTSWPEGNSLSAMTSSPGTSRRPSINANPEHRQEELHTAYLPQQQDHCDHHRHRHRHRSTDGSTSSSSHQNIASIAALAAAATAAAAGSPSPLQIPTMPTPCRTSDGGGRVAGSGAGEDASRAPLPGTIVPPPSTDPVLLAALRRLQHDQDRAAAHLLQATLADLDNLSASTGQRLDTAYGSVLSRLGVLQGTVQALRSLAITARTTNHRFRAKARSLADEVEQQVTHFEGSGSAGTGDDSSTSGAGATTNTTNITNTTDTTITAVSSPLPSDQQHRLEQLHARVLCGRKAIQALGDRVEAIRDRVERWESADLAWQERTRTRLKILWAIVSGVLLALIVLLVVTARSNKASRAALSVQGDGSSSLAADLLPTALRSDGTNQHCEDGYSGLVSTPQKHELHILFHNGSDADEDGVAVLKEGDLLIQMFDQL